MLNHRFWSMWRWLPWVLPAVFIGGRVLLGGGWEVFFLVLYSPLIVGLGGFLAWLPRFILRNKQYTTAPTLFVVVLTAHWVGMVWYLLSMRAVGDSGSQPSIVSAMVPFMTAQQESLFHAFALLFVALTLLVAFTMAILVRNADDPPLTMRRAGAGWWVLAAFIVTPLVIFGSASATDAIKLRGEPDAGGNQQADVISLDEGEVRALHQDRWQSLQEQLVPLRKSIAAAGWNPVGTQVPGYSVHESKPDTYHLDISWRVTVKAEDKAATLSGLRDLVNDAGWVIDADTPNAGGLYAASPDGVELTAQILPPTDASNDPVIRLQARSPLFWSEGTAVTWEHIDPDDYGIPNFRYDQWPKLRPRP